MGVLLSAMFEFAGVAAIHVAIRWWVLDTYSDPIYLSIIAGVVLAPVLFGVILSGIMTVRTGARRLLLVSKAAASVGAGLCAILLFVDGLSFASLCLIAFLTYAAVAPSLTADTSRAPAFARFGRYHLATFHAARSIVIVLAQLIGFVVAGFAIDKYGTSTAVTTGFASVLLSFATTWFLFPRDRPFVSHLRRAQWSALTQRVLISESARRLGLGVFFVGGVLFSVKLSMLDVVVPGWIGHVNADASWFAVAMCLAILGLVLGVAIFRFLLTHVDERATVSGSAIAAIAAIVTSIVLPGNSTLLFTVFVVSAAVGCADTSLMTGLQKNLSASLQAHGVALYQAGSLSLALFAIFIAGVAASTWMALAWLSGAILVSVFVSTFENAAIRKAIPLPSGSHETGGM